MNTTTPLLITATLLSLMAGPVLAVDAAEPTVSELELGAGYVTDDAYYLGRYDGLEQKGVFAVGNIKAEQFFGNGGYWRARGTNLGLESRYFRLEGGIQGAQEYFLEYDQLPNFINDTARTPFLSPGSDTLGLPAGFDINTNLNSHLNTFELETERQRFGLGAAFMARKYWKLDVSVRQDNKEGTQQIGAPMANGTTALTGNTTTSLLPKPVDYSTTLADMALSYTRDKGQLELAYHMSLFENDNRSLAWTDPFDPTQSGRLALAPDNEFHQLSLSGAYQLPLHSHVSAVVSVGRMTQDDEYDAFSTDPALGGLLPRSNLDGEVWLTTSSVKIASRPLRKLRLSADYTFNSRDNDSPTDGYNYVVADSHNGLPVQNNPYSFSRNRAGIRADYRFNGITSLQGGYKYDRMSRNYENVDQERNTTRENTLFAKWKVRPHSRLNMTLYGELGDRAGSDYKPLSVENTALRKYNLASRDRSRAGATLDYTPTDAVSVVLSADYIRDNFDNTEIGLTETEQPSVTLDVSYQPRRNMTTYAYFTREYISSKQRGSAIGLPVADWEADFDDEVDTFGIGARMTDIVPRWDAGADVVYTRASGEIDMDDFTAPGTETPYPDLKTSLTSIKFWTLFRQRRNVAYKLSYWYDDFSSDNWALDDLQADSITSALLLGQESPDYDRHVFALSVVYRFE